MAAAIEIYTRPGCGYCSAARSLLTRKNAAFVEFDAGKDPAHREEMYGRVGFGATFPQIFIDGRHIGGCDDLYDLEYDGKLDALLAGEDAGGPAMAG